MSSEIRGTFLGDAKWLGGVQIALRFKSLIVLPFLTRHFGATEFGVWSQVAVITAIAAPFISWGTAFGFVRTQAGSPVEARRGLFRAWIYALFFAATLVFAATLAFAPFLAREVLSAQAEGGGLIIFAVLFALSGALLNAHIVWLQVNGESKTNALVLLIQAGLSLLAIVCFLLIGGGVIRLVAFTFAVDVLLVGGLFVRYFLRYGWGRPDFAAFWRAFRYGLPLVPMSFANTGINWIDRLVLLRYLPISDVGVYNLVHGLALMIVQTITQPFRAYYPPRAMALFNAGRFDELRTLHGLSAGAVFAIQVPAAIGLFFVAPAFLSILAPPSFAEGAYALPLLFVGYALDRQTTYGLQVFEWQFRQHWVTIIHYGCFGLNLAFNFLLVPRFGIMGAALSNTMAFAARYVFVVVMVRRQSPVRGSPIFIMKILLAGGFMALVLWPLSGFLQMSSWYGAPQLAGLVIVGMAVYSSALVLLGIVPGNRILPIMRRFKQA